jgi:hypothetical protein
MVVFPNPIIVTVDVTDATCETCMDGTVTINASGGVPPYLYHQGTGIELINGNILYQLPPGVYWVWVEDSLGCKSTNMATVGVTPGIHTENINDNLLIKYNHPSGILTVHVYNAPDRQQIFYKITDVLGHLLKDEKIYQDEFIINTHDFSQGEYFIIVETKDEVLEHGRVVVVE